jgi:branched-chain amino acid transport system ATP-binding protein
MVLATDAQVLLLDEPLAGMGSDESAQMVALLNGLKKTRAILLVEHDMDAVLAVADRITVMVKGQVVFDGPSEVVRQDPELIQKHLGV